MPTQVLNTCQETVTPKKSPPERIDRATAIRRIRAGLKSRSGKAWSVTGGRGTSWGWITIQAPSQRRTWKWVLEPGLADIPGNYQLTETGKPGQEPSPQDRRELNALLGLEGSAHHQGVKIPGSASYYWEYVDRAEGVKPRRIGSPYWD